MIREETQKHLEELDHKVEELTARVDTLTGPKFAEKGSSKKLALGSGLPSIQGTTGGGVGMIWSAYGSRRMSLR